METSVWYAEKNTDFIDAFNAAWMLEHDAEKAFTFDQKNFNRFEGVNAQQKDILLKNEVTKTVRICQQGCFMR